MTITVSREAGSRNAATDKTCLVLRLRRRNLQQTKLALYKSLILPVALYGHEACTLEKAN